MREVCLLVVAYQQLHVIQLHELTENMDSPEITVKYKIY
jgi:hypothetical protein